MITDEAPRAGAGGTITWFLLGPYGTKFAQIASARPDLLPPRPRRWLQKAIGDLPYPHPRTITQTVEEAWAPNLPPFRRFDPVPLATGTIASVHRATDAGGRELALKIRRPHIYRRMRRHHAGAVAVATALDRVMPAAGISFCAVTNQVGGAVLQQLDLDLERSSLGRLNRAFHGYGPLIVPAASEEHSRPGVLAMEYIDGLTSWDKFRSTADPGEIEAFAYSLLDVAFKGLFWWGLVHCDMHPGNVLPTTNGKLAVLDAGFVVSVADDTRLAFAEFFLNLLMGKPEDCVDILVANAVSISPDADHTAFIEDVKALARQMRAEGDGSFSLPAFARNLLATHRAHGIVMSPQFAFPLLSLGVVEGLITGLHPGIKFQAHAIPILTKTRHPPIQESPQGGH